ncbi:MAG: carboxylating nicotinate-nucleotide diphosphorylase [Candidatus Aenigmarchaeota archaeon]|nr:carboxylating nicotinate-nucleotide diphosphorylase [Candidatus Aenigmarchaeota archaeon]
MNREKMLSIVYDRSFLLNTRNPEYANSLERLFKHMIKEDLNKGDITTDTLLNKRKAKARITAKTDGVLSGSEEFKWLYLNNGLKVKQFKKDGDKIKNGDKLFEVSGDGRHILYLERTGLNLLQRMSGISTQTMDICKILEKTNSNVRICATRKTQWGYLDKKAVSVGGGLAHRLGLNESFLIKDNHLFLIKESGVKKPIKTAIERAWKKRKDVVFIEVEVKNSKEIVEAAKTFKKLQKDTHESKPCVIMLDNMLPDEIRSSIDSLKKQDLYDYVLIETSGGITPENIEKYSKTGADACSLGFLTHSVKSVDISQNMY